MNWLSNINWDVRNQIMLMNENDHRVRKGGVSREKMIRVDNENEAKLKEIFLKYGYPDHNLVGNYYLGRSKVYLGSLIMHVQDIDYFKPVFYKNLKAGIGKITDYAYITDSHDRKKRKFTYRIYSDLTEEQIDDLPNLDKRRVAAGLRPWKMQLEFEKLTDSR